MVKEEGTLGLCPACDKPLTQYNIERFSVKCGTERDGFYICFKCKQCNHIISITSTGSKFPEKD